MKKRIFLLSAVVGMFITGLQYSCTSVKGKTAAFPVIQQRNNPEDEKEFTIVQGLYNEYVKALETNSQDDKIRLKLAALYLNEARMSGNTSYYNVAALETINPILAKKNVDGNILYQALVYKTTLLLSVHQFAEAKLVAEKALALNPYDADIYGALVDAHNELGNYAEAIKYCDKMIAIRPDIRSYARVSYVRQIHGDYHGAIQSMRLAVEAGAQGQENTEWARVQLANLYLNASHTDTAKMLFESSLYVRPNYPPAEFGLAVLYRHLKQYDSAMVHCKNAIRIVSESSYISLLGDLHADKNDHQKAQEIHQDVLSLLLEDEKENKKTSLLKHNGSREIAQAYLQVGNYKDALQYAQQDLNMRPHNIDANELVAYIHYLLKDYQQAALHIDKALATNATNASLLLKAAKIYKANNDEQRGNQWQQMALASNSQITNWEK